VHLIIPNIPDDCKCETFLLSEGLLGGVVIGHLIGILRGEPILSVLSHELIHDHGVQLLIFAPLGQCGAILAGNVGLNANLLFKNLLSQEDKVRISETEHWSDISLHDMSSGKPRNNCGVLPVLSCELASLPCIEYRNPGLPCLFLDEDQR
jgi:hypothetical protein